MIQKNTKRARFSSTHSLKIVLPKASVCSVLEKYSTQFGHLFDGGSEEPLLRLFVSYWVEELEKVLSSFVGMDQVVFRIKADLHYLQIVSDVLEASTTLKKIKNS